MESAAFPYLIITLAIYIIVISISVIIDYFTAKKRTFLTAVITIEYLILIIAGPILKDFSLISNAMKIVWIFLYLFILIYGGMRFIPNYVYGRQEYKKYEKKFPDAEGKISIQEFNLKQETPKYYIVLIAIAVLMLILFIICIRSPISFQISENMVETFWNNSLEKQAVFFLILFVIGEFIFHVPYLRKRSLFIFLAGIYSNVVVIRFFQDIYFDNQRKMAFFLFSCSLMLFCSPLLRTRLTVVASVLMILFELSFLFPEICQLILGEGDKQYCATLLFDACFAVVFFLIPYLIAGRNLMFERFWGIKGVDTNVANKMYVIDRKYACNLVETTKVGNDYYFHDEKVLAFYYCPFPFLNHARESGFKERKNIRMHFFVFPYFFIETEKNWYLARQTSVDGQSFYYQIDLWKKLKAEWEKQMGATNRFYRMHPEFHGKKIKPFEINLFILDKEEMHLVDKKSVCFREFSNRIISVNYPVILSMKKPLGIVKPH